MAYGIAGTRAAQLATRTIPIVMTGIIDPVAQGFVASLSHPGGNITGLSNLSEQPWGAPVRDRDRAEGAVTGRGGRHRSTWSWTG